jgi:hypothetical protein
MPRSRREVGGRWAMRKPDVIHALSRAREKIYLANEQAQTAESTPLHDAFETLRHAVSDLTDAVEALHDLAAEDRRR